MLYADKVLARDGIEACARAAWLLDPSLDPDRRAVQNLRPSALSFSRRELALMVASRWVRPRAAERLAEIGAYPLSAWSAI